MIGQTISHYKVLEKLGEGGMGEVYLAEDTSLKRKVALKFLPASLADDEVAHKRFLREAQSAAALDHPYICHINEVAKTDDGQDFIVMEYVEGQTLKEKLAEGPFLLKGVLQIASEIAEALEKAHSSGIIHRDLKPANIMLTPDGHAKVMDFGLAKKVVTDDGTEQDITSALTREGSTLGTLAYMSPEQIKAQPVDHRSDIFSFGIALYEMLTGVHPFRRAQAVETTSAILKEEPPALTRYQEDLSEVLQHMVRRMLSKSPDERYQSVHEVRTDLVDELNLLSSFDTAPYAKPTPSRISPLTMGLTALGLVIVAVLIYWNWGFLTEPSDSPVKGRNSIAVLPFDNLSPDPEDVYFSDGMTEDITTELSRISGLKVIARTSSFRFRDSDKPIRQIADELGVETILEGSVRRSGDHVRIVAQLIAADSEEHLWAQSYDRELIDVFEIQSDVAKQIASALGSELSTQDIGRFESLPTHDLEAYDAYLQGRFNSHQETPASLQKAVEYLQEALTLDPDFAAAHAELARIHVIMDYLEVLPHGQAMQLALHAAANALELGPASPKALSASAMVEEIYNRNWNGAETKFQEALEIGASADIHWDYGWLLVRMGRFEEGMEQMRVVRELDPLSPRAQMRLGMVYFYRREYRKALEELLKGEETDLYRDYFLGWAYEYSGDLQKAAVLHERLVESYGFRGFFVAQLIRVYAKMGREVEARSLLSQLDERSESGLGCPYLLAAAYMAFGDEEKVLDLLEQAYLEHRPMMVQLKTDPHWDPIRDDPRFVDLMRRMNFPE
jgi:serine/threonine-protein kinase